MVRRSFVAVVASWVLECTRLVPAPAKLPRINGGRQGTGVAQWRAVLLGVAAYAGLASCAVGPDYHPPAPPVPENFVSAARPTPGDDRRLAGSTQWWRTLHDRELNSLIDRAIAASPTLEIALQRVQQARAQEAIVIGMALPALGGTEGGGIGTGSDLGRGRAAQTLVSAETGAGGITQIANLAGFAAAWEIDVFGKYRRAIEAAQYDVDAAAAARNVVLISVIADVTRAYLDLRALQMRLLVLRKDIVVAQKYVDFVQERFNRGITNELDVTLAQREYAQLLAQVAPLIGQINASRYVIAVLIGEFPENLGGELSRPAMLPPLPRRVRPGLPIQVLRRRPDIAEAERQLAGATARIGVATADLFPDVAVTAAVGNQLALGSGIPINPIWAVGPAVAAPLLDFGRLDAAVEKADFRARELFFNYKQTVLNAVREVDTAVAAYAAQQDRLRHLGDALIAARRAVELATERFDRGLIDSLNVIDAQRQEYEIEQQYISAQQAAAEQLVTLYKSLGSGWEDYQIFPAIPPPLPAVVAAFKALLVERPLP
jgi:NodT family efflux transporter outer membrane factor (OMF) lipoprotein